MARKRKTLNHLDYNSPEYWNRLLSEDGLSMDAGRDTVKLNYVGNSTDLEGVIGKIVAGRAGTGGGKRIMPKKKVD